MKCVCLPDPVSGATTVVDHIRLFRNNPAVRWRYRVHEQILPAVRQAGGQGRWADLEQVAGRLADGPQAATEAAVVRARAALARQEFGAARALLEAAIRAAPAAVWPQVILSHVLLQEGRDWAAADRALRDVLALEPGHAEARRNLAVLGRRRTSPAAPPA
jgi:hypothetical protein